MRSLLSCLAFGDLSVHAPDMFAHALLGLDVEHLRVVLELYVVDSRIFVREPEIDPEFLLEASLGWLELAEAEVLAEHEGPFPEVDRRAAEAGDELTASELYGPRPEDEDTAA